MFVLDIYIIQLQDGETVGNMVIQTILLVYNVDAMYGLRCLEKKSSFRKKTSKTTILINFKFLYKKIYKRVNNKVAKNSLGQKKLSLNLVII